MRVNVKMIFKDGFARFFVSSLVWVASDGLCGRLSDGRAVYLVGGVWCYYPI